MKHKRIMAALFAGAVSICLMTAHAGAAEQTEDGVTLTVSADKAEYGAGEQIKVAVSVANNSGSDLTDISVKSAIPAHYRLAEGSGSVLRSTYIQAGGSISAELILEPEPDAAEETETAAQETVTEAADTTQPPQTQTTSAQTQPVQTVGSTQEKKGLSLSTWLLILGAAAGAAGVVSVVMKKRKSRQLAVILCIAAAGALYPAAEVSAAEAEVKSFSVSEHFTADGTPYTLTAEITYSKETEDMQAAVAEYYADNSEQVISVEAADETAEVFTEQEVIRFLSERGFAEYPVTYDYNMDGTYTDEAEASPDSDAKHPMYQTYYVAADSSVWTVFIVGRMIAANPVSYNLESDLKVQVLVSETETLTSYTEMGNQFYTTIPKDTAVLLRVVDQITSNTLDTLTFEEVINS